MSDIPKDLLERAEKFWIQNMYSGVTSAHQKVTNRTNLAKFAQAEIDRVKKEDGKAIDAWWEKLNLEKQQSEILKRTLEKERALVDCMSSAAEMLWVVLANVSEGNWDKQSKEWKKAAILWRDNYFKALQDFRKARK